MCQHKKTTNLSSFSPSGDFGKLFKQAKLYNKINTELNNVLPKTLSGLELCLIKNNVATFITNNQSVAFRAKQQISEILSLIHSIPDLQNINHVDIKVTVK